MSQDGPGAEHYRENAVDYFQQGVAIMPGSDRKYPVSMIMDIITNMS